MASQKIGITGLTLILGILVLSGAVLAADDLPIVDGTKVRVEYTILLPDKTTIATHVHEYVHGEHQIVPGLEEALTGMRAGETKQVELAPSEAFGLYDETKRRRVNRRELPGNAEPGSILETEEGQLVTVLELSERSALLDFNHPLAGKHVVFQVKVLRVRGNTEVML